ncbi:MAG: aminotransferase class V-fold PLP-dependent enzyme [Candidatus Kariarchaeaceae archaeon]|jgi:selenocysteine lyase/cysteine desulfurase
MFNIIIKSKVQMDPSDVLRARQETPATQKIIHFNNAGASLMPQPVLNSITDYLQLESEIGGYEAAAKSEDIIESVYESICSLINAEHDEIAIIENATRAWDMAFYSIPFKKGDRILTAQAEYGSNYLGFLQVARRSGVKIDVIPNDIQGQLSVEVLENLIDDDVKLISVTHVPTNGGLVNPAEEIGKIAKENNILYQLDACQSVGQMPIDVEKIGCDILSATGRKFLRGPRGTGFLYVNKKIIEDLEPPFIDLHAAEWVSKNEYVVRSDAKRFENWESYVAGKFGLGKAIDYAMNWGLESIWARIRKLANLLREELSQNNSITLHDVGKEKCGIVTFDVQGKDLKELRDQLIKQGINVAVSSKMSTLLDMENRTLESLIRTSIHYYNTEEEISKFCSTIKSLS